VVVSEPPGVADTLWKEVKDPELYGLKSTPTLQVPPGASAPLQVLEEGRMAPPFVKSVLTAPVGRSPAFATVNSKVDELPEDAIPKSNEVGEMVKAGAVAPVPASAELTVPPGVALTSSAPLRAPRTVGAKVMFTEQLAPGPSTEGQPELAM
jgi:hypothetical protein